MQKTNDVIALGNALMDFLIRIDEKKFVEMNLNKGEMHLVDEQQAKALLKKIKEQQLSVEYVPGGSAANTMRGLALLGAKVMLVGKVGHDSHGEMYLEQMQKEGVISKLNRYQKPTGHAVTFITPDSERTFSVHLGAAVELVKEDIVEEDIAKSRILYIEGYQLEGKTRESILHAIAIARKHGTIIAMDLADPGVVRRNKDFLKDLIEKNVDIVFANENEAKELTGLDKHQAAISLGKSIPIAIVKLGEKGSLVYADGSLIEIPPFPANALDTTGAGDTYAAGFLYGYCQGWDLKKAGKLGSLLAAKVVERYGVKLFKEEMEEIRNFLEDS